MAGMDKITRVLLIYSKLSQGGRIYKKSFCVEMGIDRRTFDRDIEDIRLYLSESFYGSDLVYDRSDESYHLETICRNSPLSAMEITFILELLTSCRVLRKDEYVGIVTSLLNAGEPNRRGELEKITGQYIRHYSEEKKDALLKIQWDLQQCIAEMDKVILYFQDKAVLCVSPVKLWIYEQEIYLFAYGDDAELHVFPVTDIEFFKMENKKFHMDLLQKFSRLSWEEIRLRMEKVRCPDEEN